MGRLLLGDPDRVKARWRDVLHPSAADQIREGDEPWKAFWRTTLERPRLMGPSTHAFVSRALRHFANRILPWVVEREFGGRLIYAGGDDALALCPAADALALLARLDRLYTSAWVLDRHPEADPWPTDEPRDPLYEVGGDRARERFDTLDKDARGTRGRIVPMLGEHQSFSAGVAFGHFKTFLRLLRSQALAARDSAKEAGGRRAGLRWFTRNGVKLRWTAALRDEAGGVEQIRRLAAGFGNGTIPGRLPYKLRDALPAAVAAVEKGRLDLLDGLAERALDGASSRIGDIMGTWKAGFPKNINGHFDPEASLGGLLVARALAGKEER
jgi:CRISPR-associated protein Cmr2